MMIMQRASSALRLLTDAEIDEISGGQDIVVTALYTYGEGARMFLGYEDSNSGWEPYETLSPEPGGYNAQWNWFVPTLDILVDIIKDVLMQKAQNAEAREGLVGNMFDPGQIDKDALKLTVKDSAGTRNGIRMLDGSVFWDTNGNDIPDFITKEGQDGIVYGNDGGGWYPIG